MKINAIRLSDVCGSGQKLDRSQESTDARVEQMGTPSIAYYGRKQELRKAISPVSIVYEETCGNKSRENP